MAGEIRTPHPSSTTGLTLYALLWDSTSQVCTVSSGAFGAYSTGSLANYKITLTEKGTASRFYAGNVPANVAAGVYLVTIYEQAGGSPAEGDILIATQELEWSGTAVISLYSRLAPTVAGRTLDVSSGGEAGIDWANVGTPGSSVNLSSTTVGTVSSVTALAANAITGTSFHYDTGGQPVRSNTAAGGASTSITLDASASSTTDAYKYCTIVITSGTGAGQRRLCTAYNGTTKVATVTPAWVTNPAMGTSTFAVLNEGIVDAETVALTQLTARDIGASVLLSSGTGTGQLDFTSGVVKGNLVQMVGVAQSATDLKDFADDGYDPSTNKVQGVVLVDTLTTYTGNTPQTGDSYAIVNSGTHGNAALKTLIDTVDDLVDTEVAAILAAVDTEVGAIKAKTDQFVFTVANQVDANALSGGGGLDAAGVRAAVGLASANLDTQLSTIDDFLDTEVGAIKAKTDYLPSVTAGAAGGLFIAGTNAPVVITGEGNALTLESTSLDGSGLMAIGHGEGQGAYFIGGSSETSGSSSAGIAAYGGGEDAPGILAVGDGVGADIHAPNSTWNQCTTILSNIAALHNFDPANDVVAHVTLVDTLTTYTGNTVQTGDSYAIVNSGTHGNAALKTLIDDLPTNAELATSQAAADDATLAAISALTIPTAAQNAAALMDLSDGVEVGLTPRQALRLISAALAGELSGAATTTIVIRNAVADSKDRITATVDSDGNRSALTLDLT